MPQIPKILERLPRGRVEVRISDYHGDEPSREMRDFCGPEVMREVETLQRKIDAGTRQGGKIPFERDGQAYHIYCGENPSPNITGRFLYNVYIYPDADAKSDR